MDGDDLMVGRTAELARVVGLARRPIDGGLFLVTGDAGIGKTRLLSEAISVCAAGDVHVVVGRCLPVTVMLPLLPMVEALRSLAALGNGTLLRRVIARQPPYVGEELARLLPELTDLGELGPQHLLSGTSDGWQRQRLFAAVGAVLRDAAEREGAMIALEDLHWADPSTLDLLTYLQGTGRTGPLIFATLRTGEPDDGRGVRQWLAGVRQFPSLTEIRLGPLGWSDVSAQASHVLRHEAAEALVSALYARSEGNPLFLKHLLASLSANDTQVVLPSRLPEQLRDLLVSRVARCSASARLVLAALCVTGRPLEARWLARVSGVPVDAVEEALEELLDVHLVATDDAGRSLPSHALIVEAVAAGLLRTRRSALHVLAAEALAAMEGTAAAAEIAGHWQAAGRAEEELASRVAAARAAGERHGFAEAAHHWTRVTQLWDLAPSARPSDLTLAEVYRLAVDFGNPAGRYDESQELLREGLVRVAGSADAYGRAVLLSRSSWYYSPEAFVDPMSACRGSVQLFENLPASEDKALALDRYSGLLDDLGRHDEAAAAAGKAAAVARACGSSTAEVHSLETQALRAMYVGDNPERALSHLVEARAVIEADTSGPGGATARDLAFHVAKLVLMRVKFLRQSDRLAEAARYGREGLANAHEQFMRESMEVSLTVAEVGRALLELGHVAEAGTWIFPWTAGPPVGSRSSGDLLRAEVDVLAGRRDAAWARLEAVNAVAWCGWSQQRYPTEAVAEMRLWSHRPDLAGECVRAGLRELPARDSRFAGRLVAIGMRAQADLADQARATGNKAALASAIAGGEQLADRVRSLPHSPFASARSPSSRQAWGAVWEAELDRLRGADTRTEWGLAVSAWDAVGRPHRAAYARWRLCEAELARDGPAPRTSAVLVEAMGQAVEHAPLLEELSGLARRARIDVRDLRLAPPALVEPQAPAPFGLTARERQVLALVADGRTNGQIGAALFMSPKTASVHVTSIMRKMGVHTRLQAAMLAERGGVIDE